jgi:hypothetical protein
VAVQGKVVGLQLNLNDLASIDRLVQDLKGEARIDYLILNAGILSPLKKNDEKGWEIHFSTNHCGHFALTMGLLDKLKAQVRPPHQSWAITSSVSIVLLPITSSVGNVLLLYCSTSPPLLLLYRSPSPPSLLATAPVLLPSVSTVAPQDLLLCFPSPPLWHPMTSSCAPHDALYCCPSPPLLLSITSSIAVHDLLYCSPWPPLLLPMTSLMLPITSVAPLLLIPLLEGAPFQER